jgi:chaperonin GroES
MIRRVNMKIRPLGERVLIKQTKQEETTKSGIVLPDTASKEKPIIGEVTAVGEAIKEIKIGDKVIYEKYAGTEVKDNDEVYLLLEEKNVLAVVE